MFCAALCAVLLCTSLVIAEKTLLQLNTNSTVYADIKFIAHNVDKKNIVIELKESRRCLTPQFIVRLSGTSLYKLDFNTEISLNGGKYTYTYPSILDPGLYYIEIMIIYCNALNSNDNKNLCVEEVQNGLNILTLPYNFTYQANDQVVQNHTSPRWVLPRSSLVTPMLSTRYQKKTCGAQANEYCKSPTIEEIHQHRLYEWTDKPDWVEPMNTVLNINGFKDEDDSTNTTTLKLAPAVLHAMANGFLRICYFGDAHTHELYKHTEKIVAQNPLLKESIRITWTSVSHPNQFKIKMLEGTK